MKKYKKGETIFVASGHQLALPDERVVTKVKRDGTYEVASKDPNNLMRWIAKPAFIIPTREQFEIECEEALDRIEDHKKHFPEHYGENRVPFPTISAERYHRTYNDPMIPETQNNWKWVK